ncbi:MAG: IS30 family transposase [Nitrospira sp.]
MPRTTASTTSPALIIGYKALIGSIALDGDDLCGPVSLAAQRTAGDTAAGAQDPPASVAGNRSTRPPPEHDADCRPPCRGREPHCPRPLGRRPHHGARNASAIGSLVERTTRLVILARMAGTDAGSAREGFTRKLRHVPAPLRRTLIYDRGKEMAEHERLAQRLAIQVCFADPRSPWQCGTNANTNGLLRQYLPKGTDLSGSTQRELNAIAHRLNTRPRKCLHFATPLEAFTQLRHHSPVALGT